MIFLQATFSTLLYTYLVIIVALSIISIVLNRKKMKDYGYEKINETTNYTIYKLVK